MYVQPDLTHAPNVCACPCAVRVFQHALERSAECGDGEHLKCAAHRMVSDTGAPCLPVALPTGQCLPATAATIELALVPTGSHYLTLRNS